MYSLWVGVHSDCEWTEAHVVFVGLIAKFLMRIWRPFLHYFCGFWEMGCWVELLEEW